MAFIYSHKPMQLGYLDPTYGIVLLPFWISNHSDLAVAIAGIRTRRWGNLASGDFWIRVWNNYSVGTPDGESPIDIRIYNATGDLPVSTPSYNIMKNNLLS